MFFFPFLRSGTPCFRDVLQPASYYFVPDLIWLSASLYSECTVFTVIFYYLQVLAMYKEVLSSTKSIMN